MRVLILAEFAGLWDAPGGLRHLGFSRCWVRNGHEVVILTAALSSKQNGFVEQVVDGVRVVSVPMGTRDPVANNKAGFFARIAGFAGYSIGTLLAWREFKASDIVLVSSPPLTACLGGVFWAQMFGKPIVFEIRDLWPDAAVQLGHLRNGLLIRFSFWLERLIRARSAHVVALSPGLKWSVIELKEEKSRISVIPNACDEDMLGVGQVKLIGAGSRSGHAIRVLYAGALGHANAIDLLMEALEELGKSAKPGRFQVQIKGDGRFRKDLERFVESMGLSWIGMTQAVARREMPGHFAWADISLVLFKSAIALRHGSPNKLFDSIACGCPVLVNTDGWMKDFVEMSGIGFSCEPGSGMAIAKSLLGLDGRNQELQMKGLRAFQVAKAGFCRQFLAGKYEQILEGVCSGSIHDFDAFREHGLHSGKV